MVNKLKIQEQSNLSLLKIIQNENIKFSELKALSNVCLSESLIPQQSGRPGGDIESFSTRQ